jgi:hypothetical protein
MTTWDFFINKLQPYAEELDPLRFINAFCRGVRDPRVIEEFFRQGGSPNDRELLVTLYETAYAIVPLALGEEACGLIAAHPLYEPSQILHSMGRTGTLKWLIAYGVEDTQRYMRETGQEQLSNSMVMIQGVFREALEKRKRYVTTFLRASLNLPGGLVQEIALYETGL